MSLIEELKKNDGEFDYYDEFAEEPYEYESAIKSLIKNKNYALAYKVLACYIREFKEISKYPTTHYQPGMDYLCSYYMFYAYAKMMEKGIKGVVDSNKEEAEYAYLQLLKRFPHLSHYLKTKVVDKSNILLKHAYPDLMDNYSDALYEVGNYFFEKKDYKKAFRFFKKGADFNCDGRQIYYPYFLIGRNQDKVGDMYRYGLGVKKNYKNAIKYYKLCAENCGRRYHAKLGDILLKQKNYSGAFLYYTDANPNHPYNYAMWFMTPKNIKRKFKTIFNGINNKPEKSKKEMCVLAMIYFAGLGVEKNILKYKELLPEGECWTNEWIHDYIFANLNE